MVQASLLRHHQCPFHVAGHRRFGPVSELAGVAGPQFDQEFAKWQNCVFNSQSVYLESMCKEVIVLNHDPHRLTERYFQSVRRQVAVPHFHHDCPGLSLGRYGGQPRDMQGAQEKRQALPGPRQWLQGSSCSRRVDALRAVPRRCWTKATMGGYVNRCVNDIRRRPSQPLIQWRFHPHTVHGDRRLRSTQGPSDA